LSNYLVIEVKVLVTEMRVVIGAIAQFDAEIEALCQTHSDFQIFASLPGSGTLHAARLLSACGTHRDRFDSAAAMACFSGLAPVIERSGESCWIRWRYFCPKFVRQSFHEYAGESIKHSAWARAFYAAQRSRGKSHAAALRSLA
jgi:transposase